MQWLKSLTLLFLVILTGCSQNSLPATQASNDNLAPIPPQLATEAPLLTAPPQAATEAPSPTVASLQTLSLEDWNRVFQGKVADEYGYEYELQQALSDETEIVEYDSSKDFSRLTSNFAGLILKSNGTIVGFPVLSDASEGDFLVIAKNPNQILVSAALEAAWLDYSKPPNERLEIKVKLTKQECQLPPGVMIDIANELHPVSEGGRFVSPILETPPVFYVLTPNFDHMTPEEANIIIDDPKYWLDSVIKAGFNKVMVSPCAFQ